MLRDAAIKWVRTNCSSPQLHADFQRQLDQTISLGVNCSFTIGGDLTRIMKPYLLHWFGGELFIFQLTPPQAGKLGIGPKMFRHACDHESVKDGSPAVPSLSLEKLELEQPVVSDLSKPIAARCRFGITGRLPPDVAFRMDFAQAANSGTTTFFAVARSLAPSEAGTISLAFEPVRLSPEISINAVMAVFVRCFATNNQPAMNWSPISNPVAALLELADGSRQTV